MVENEYSNVVVPRLSGRVARLALSLAACVPLVCLSACAAGRSHSDLNDLNSGEAFRSPEDAAQAVIDAAAAEDEARLVAIFGPDSQGLLRSGDAVADRAALEKFVTGAREKHTVDKQADDRVVLEFGNDDWPFPIPLVKTRQGWRFDTAAGKEELVNRRIGRNEIGAINSSLAYVDAQRDYAARMREARRENEYAQRIRSTSGRHDGLFWPVREGERESPLGPAFAEAAGEGYKLEGAPETPQPFHGYLFRVLTAQGSHAPQGQKSYMRGGHLRDGFALVAYPAQYGSSGVMTFIVNQQGVVFQKDLGEQTNELASTMTEYDPDDSWDPVEPVNVPDTDTSDTDVETGAGS